MMSLRRPWSNCQVAIAMAKDSERIWEKTRNRGTQTELGGRQARWGQNKNYMGHESKMRSGQTERGPQSERMVIRAGVL